MLSSRQTIQPPSSQHPRCNRRGGSSAEALAAVSVVASEAVSEAEVLGLVSLASGSPFLRERSNMSSWQ
eukprot:CAMPEP_0115330342 /NCGR_PEP_ID=MMETSP0270-20121206/85722_1 /TAXON_ID=71861 /ORGANISM="Scrippsiella trochoidea, Strain CCMP3099" /LENGTH=68 /DNA_ID=CAMNT_0002751043 /DNA_START=91 /DNA_END=297 /DNA_ORIENTATION=-